MMRPRRWVDLAIRGDLRKQLAAEANEMGDAIGEAVKGQTAGLKAALRADTAAASPGLAKVQKAWRSGYFRNDPTKGQFPAGTVFVKGAIFEAFQEDQVIRPEGGGRLWIVTDEGRGLMGRRGAGGRFGSLRSISRLMDVIEQKDFKSFVRPGKNGSLLAFVTIPGTKRRKPKVVLAAVGVKQVRARKLLNSNEIIAKAQAEWAGNVAQVLAAAFPPEG